ncbi:MAG: hypothetical protein EA351_00985 [Gemmatimonadales bacterium]|nr:MAG: hypothetical protein EA351_00985 [Gemmatimonadales bacterium]
MPLEIASGYPSTAGEQLHSRFRGAESANIDRLSLEFLSENPLGELSVTRSSHTESIDERQPVIKSWIP